MFIYRSMLLPVKMRHTVLLLILLAVSSTSASMKTVEVKKGDPASLNCSASPFQGWYKFEGNKPRQIKVDHRRSVQNGKLHFAYVEMKDNGIYQCAAHTVDGMKFKGKIFLSVTQNNDPSSGRPGLLSKSKDTSVMQGQNATLTCVFSGKPLPTITWYHEKNMVQTDKNTMISSLELHSVTSSSEGSYTCEASNGAGSVKEIIKIVVIPLTTSGLPPPTGYTYTQPTKRYLRHPDKTEATASQTKSGSPVALPNKLAVCMVGAYNLILAVTYLHQ